MDKESSSPDPESTSPRNGVPARRRSRASLRTKIIAWSFVPTLVILVIVASFTLNAYQRVTETLVIERNEELTRLSANQLATKLTEYTHLLAALARAAGIDGNDPVAQRDALKGAGNRLAVFDGGTLILDALGRVLAAEPEWPGALEQSWSDSALYREIVLRRVDDSPDPVFSNIVADGVDGTEVVALAMPIIGDQAEFRGS